MREMTKLITDEALQRLRELEAKATPGPWIRPKYWTHSEEKPAPVAMLHRGGSSGPWLHVGLTCDVARPQDHIDTDYISESREAMPLLLDTVARLKEALAIARYWAKAPRVTMEHANEFEDAMARIRELVGDV